MKEKERSKMMVGKTRKIEAPVWKTVAERKPFCPKCGAEMQCPPKDPDVATLYEFQCTNIFCNLVC